MSFQMPILIEDYYTLAIDVGIVNFGWVLYNPNFNKVIDFGLIKINNAKNGNVALAREIKALMNQLTKDHNEIVVVVEKQTGRNHFNTSITLRSIEMAIVMYCVNNFMTIVTVTPTEIQSYFGLRIKNRKAKKLEAIKLTTSYFMIQEHIEKWAVLEKQDDIADALLIALYYNKTKP